MAVWPSTTDLPVLWPPNLRKMVTIIVLTSKGNKMLKVGNICDCIYYGVCHMVSFCCLLLLLLKHFCPQITKPQLIYRIRIIYNWHHKKSLSKMALPLVNSVAQEIKDQVLFCLFSWCIIIFVLIMATKW